MSEFFTNNLCDQILRQRAEEAYKASGETFLDRLIAQAGGEDAVIDGAVAAATRENAPKTAPKPEKVYTPHPVDLNGVHESVRRCHEEARAFIKAFRAKETPYWLTLYGPSGVGKTMMATNVATVISPTHRRAQVWRWSRVFDRLMGGDWALMQHLCKLPVLVLDDVGTTYTGSDKARDAAAAHLLELFEGRARRWTILTMNLTPGDLGDSLDVRLTSRLYRENGRLVDMRGANDYCYEHSKK